MDRLIATMLDKINSLDPSVLNKRVERRFLEPIEVPMCELLHLPAPQKKDKLSERVYTTYIGTSNNIDNRLWQAQNKMLNQLEPQLAVALCPDNLVQDRMFRLTAQRLTRLSLQLGLPQFQGVLILSSSSDDPILKPEPFAPAKLLLHNSATLRSELEQALPGIPIETYPTGGLAPSAALPDERTPTFLQPEVQDEAHAIRRLLNAYRNVVVEGVAGTGKSHIVDALSQMFEPGCTELAVFHPGSTYEDFVEGLRPTIDGGFKVRDGRFLSFCKRAAARPETEFLFVIDEINRASPGKVLGDLLYSIEPSKRVDARLADKVLNISGITPSSQHGPAELPTVSLQHERSGPEGVYAQQFCVPANVFILGTMNTSDHSIGVLDLALRRRFVFHRFEPMVAQSLLRALAPLTEESDLTQDVYAWQAINEILVELSPDAKIGHSYFFEVASAARRLDLDDASQLSIMLWRDLLLPQLAATLTAYDGLHLLPELDSTVLAIGSDTGGYWLMTGSSGLDAYPVVATRSSQDPPGSPPSAADVLFLDSEASS